MFLNQRLQFNRFVMCGIKSMDPLGFVGVVWLIGSIRKFLDGIYVSEKGVIQE